MDPRTKRRYNITFKLRKMGFIVNSQEQEIVIYFREVKRLVGNKYAIALVHEYSYSLVENRQLEINL